MIKTDELRKLERSAMIWMLWHVGDKTEAPWLFNQWCDKYNLYISDVDVIVHMLDLIGKLRKSGLTVPSRLQMMVNDGYITQTDADKLAAVLMPAD